MRGEQRVHVGLQPQFGVDGPLVKFDLDKAIGVRADDEVDLRPVNHDYFLYVVHDIRQLCLSDPLHAAIGLRGPELPVQYLVLLDPLGAQHVLLADLVRVVHAEERRHELLQGRIVQEAVLELDYRRGFRLKLASYI